MALKIDTKVSDETPPETWQPWDKVKEQPGVYEVRTVNNGYGHFGHLLHDGSGAGRVVVACGYLYTNPEYYADKWQYRRLRDGQRLILTFSN